MNSSWRIFTQLNCVSLSLVCSVNQFCAVHLTIPSEGRVGSDAIEALRRGEQAAEAHRRPRQSADQDADDRGQGADTRTAGGTTD